MIAGTFALLGIGMSQDERGVTIRELSDRYVEQIDLSCTSTGSSTRDLVVIDGITRYDCFDDPLPTPEN